MIWTMYDGPFVFFFGTRPILFAEYNRIYRDTVDVQPGRGFETPPILHMLNLLAAWNC